MVCVGAGRSLAGRCPTSHWWSLFSVLPLLLLLNTPRVVSDEIKRLDLFILRLVVPM